MSFSILFVCTGNICRSPLAERLLHARLGAAVGDGRGSFVIGSAGTHGWEGSAMDPTAAAQLVRLGGDPTGFRGRQLTAELIAAADLVLTATRAHRRVVLGELPEALRRTFTMCEFAHLVDGSVPTTDTAAALVAWAASRRGSATLDDYDVADPYGASAAVHQQVADHIATCVDGVVSALTAASGSATSETTAESHQLSSSRPAE